MKQKPEDILTASQHKGAGHIDYRETNDLTEAHMPVAREHSVGTPGGVPVPLWLIAVSGVAIFWAGAYLGMFNGGFSSTGFDESGGLQKGPPPGMTTAATGGGATEVLSPRDLGKRYFSQNCVSCHQANGMGVPGQYPPLAGSEFVQGGTRRLGMILLKGLQGHVKVKGAEFNGAMPAWEKTLTNEKIADILTYVRSEWGNNALAVVPDQLAGLRKDPAITGRTDPWSEADLLAVPADAQLEGGVSAPAPAAGGAGAAASPVVGGGGEQKK